MELRVRPCCVSCFQACYDAMNIFGKHGIKNLAEKLKQIGEIREVTPDCEGSPTHENLQGVLL